MMKNIKIPATLLALAMSLTGCHNTDDPEAATPPALVLVAAVYDINVYARQRQCPDRIERAASCRQPRRHRISRARKLLTLIPCRRPSGKHCGLLSIRQDGGRQRPPHHHRRARRDGCRCLCMGRCQKCKRRQPPHSARFQIPAVADKCATAQRRPGHGTDCGPDQRRAAKLRILHTGRPLHRHPRLFKPHRRHGKSN